MGEILDSSLRTYEVRGDRFDVEGDAIEVVTETKTYYTKTGVEALVYAEEDFFRIKEVRLIGQNEK